MAKRVVVHDVFTYTEKDADGNGTYRYAFQGDTVDLDAENLKTAERVGAVAETAPDGPEDAVHWQDAVTVDEADLARDITTPVVGEDGGVRVDGAIVSFRPDAVESPERTGRRGGRRPASAKAEAAAPKSDQPEK